jgi:hypothetical protein
VRVLLPIVARLSAYLVLLATLWTEPTLVWSQRVIFPTQSPATIAAPTQPFSAQPSFLGTAQAPANYTTPFNYSAPAATIPPTPQPTLQPSLPAVRPWDPYADPGVLNQPAFAPPATAPASPYAYGAQPPYGAQPQGPFGQVPGYLEGAYRETVRVLQAVRGQDTWISGEGGFNDFDINTTELSASFAIPVGQIQGPLLITPRFNFNWWAGPQSSAIGPPRDLPSRVYDAFLETSWRPQFGPNFGADLAVAVGVFSDFKYTDKNTLRVMGRGLGLITLTPTTQLAIGAWYINRDRVKLLPAGGFIFRPNPDTTYEILFPNPSVTQRLTTYGATEIFGRLAGEYGGGQWTITHDDGSRDVVNYNDMRIIVGVEGVQANRFRASADVGYVFNREILLRNQPAAIEPGDSVLVRLGLQY